MTLASFPFQHAHACVRFCIKGMARKMRAKCLVLRYITRVTAPIWKRSDLQIIYHRVQYRSHVQHCITRLLEYLQILLKGPTASQNNAEGKMALMEALNTASVVYSDGLSERSSCYDYCSSSVECSPGHSPSHRSLDHSNRLIMNDKDKGIYNSLGSSSSPHGKVRIVWPVRI